jgi:dTDP-4-amino-4,6-dideoxygalactose transaminase
MTVPKKEINVTRPFLPPLEEVTNILNDVWESRVLSNSGQKERQFSYELRDLLDVDFISLQANATLALVNSLKTLPKLGEVITTPFSFVATANAIRLSGFNPVFADIDRDTLNISPHSIEKMISDKTVAIMPVHCYGTPCDFESINQIAKSYNLNVIYDAAHAFGVRDEKGSILKQGDASILSFHATKIFNTFEGGAIITNNEEFYNKVENLKNFGFENLTTLSAIGLNTKMSEFNSALGLAQLPYFNYILKERERVAFRYRENFRDVNEIEIKINWDYFKNNYSYLPILVKAGPERHVTGLQSALTKVGINTRRYFYPLISDFTQYTSYRRDELPNATEVANEILCLPIYPELSRQDVDFICAEIVKYLMI